MKGSPKSRRFSMRGKNAFKIKKVKKQKSSLRLFWETGLGREIKTVIGRWGAILALWLFHKPKMGFYLDMSGGVWFLALQRESAQFTEVFSIFDGR